MARREYEELLASLYRLEAAKGIDFKLDRVAQVLQTLGKPHRRFPSIHVAGTNGKGSVAAMLHAMLSAVGWRVGLYTSPHLVRLTERIRIGRDEIDEDAVVDLAGEVRHAAGQSGVELTFFEFLTVLGFLHFARQRVDLAVVEVGLGGRLDATNVLDPVASVITSIGLDHQEFLGDTLAAIAAEKAGIIKAGRPVIIGRVPCEVEPIFARAAAACGAPAYWWGRDFSATGTSGLCFSGFGRVLSDFALALPGTYQRDNATTAIAAAHVVGGQFPVPETAIRHGLATVCWPGRLDVVSRQPLVLLDGAHNVDGIKALVRELPGIVSGRRVHLLFAVMRDKQWQPMIDVIAPRVASVTVTSAPTPRSEPLEALAAAFGRSCEVSAVRDPIDGLEAVLRSAGSDDAVIVTGSLFLVGAVYHYFLGRSGEARLFSPPRSHLHA